MTDKGFFKLLFSSFFRWWWVAITGLASLIPLTTIPDEIKLGRTTVTVIVFLIFALLFLCLSTVYQGWMLYQNRVIRPKVKTIHKFDEKGAEMVCLIEGLPSEAYGKIAELKRSVNGVEVPFAIVEFNERNVKGQFQAKVLWMDSFHLRDYRTNKFTLSDLVVDSFVNRSSTEYLPRQVEGR